MGETKQHARNPDQLGRIRSAGEPHFGQILETSRTQYRLIEQIGQGGMGQVWRAETSQNTIVAVKFIRQFCSDLSQYKSRLRKEAELAGDMNHPNVTKVIEFVDRDDACFLVMEYVAGGDLLLLMEKSGTSPGSAVNAKCIPSSHVCQIAKGIADVYVKAQIAGRRIIHRDLKPENILLDLEGNPKLSDFGIAKDLDETMDLTQTGFAPGTMAYIAPERFHDPRGISVQSDMYSLGIIMFRMLTGRHPFKAKSSSEYKKAHCWTIPPTVHSINPEVSARVSDIVSSLLAKKPEARLSPSELVAALARTEEGREPEFPTAYKSWMKHPGYYWMLKVEHNFKLVAALLVMFVLLLGSTTFFLSRATSSSGVEAGRFQMRKAEFASLISESKSYLREHEDDWDGAIWKKAQLAIGRAYSAAQDSEDKRIVSELRTQLNVLESRRQERLANILLEAQTHLNAAQTYGQALKSLEEAAGLVRYPSEAEKVEAMKAQCQGDETRRHKSFDDACKKTEKLLTELSESLILSSILAGELHCAHARSLAVSTEERERVVELSGGLAEAEKRRRQAYWEGRQKLIRLLKAARDLTGIQAEMVNLRSLMRSEDEQNFVSAKEIQFRELRIAEEHRVTEFNRHLEAAISYLQSDKATQSFKSAQKAQRLARSEAENETAEQAVVKARYALSTSLIERAKVFEEDQRYRGALELYRQASVREKTSQFDQKIAMLQEKAGIEEAKAIAIETHQDLLSRAWRSFNQTEWAKAASYFREALAVSGYEKDSDAIRGLVLSLNSWGSALALEASTDEHWKAIAEKAEEARKYDEGNPVSRQQLERAKDKLKPPVVMIRTLFVGKEYRGAAIFVNGKLLQQKTPVTLNDLYAGNTYNILVNAGEAFVPYNVVFPVQKGTNTLNIDLVSHAQRTLESCSVELLPVCAGSIGKAEISSAFWIGAEPIEASHWGRQKLTWSAADEFCRHLTAREREENHVPPGYVLRLPTVAELLQARKYGRLKIPLRVLCLDRYDSLASRVSCVDPVGPVWRKERVCISNTVPEPVAAEVPVDAELIVVLARPLERRGWAEFPVAVRESVQKALELYSEGKGYLEAVRLFNEAIAVMPQKIDSWQESILLLQAYVDHCRAYIELSALRGKYLDGLGPKQKLSRQTVQQVEAGVHSIVSRYNVIRDDKYGIEVQRGILNQAKKAQAPERPRIF